MQSPYPTLNKLLMEPFVVSDQSNSIDMGSKATDIATRSRADKQAITQSNERTVNFLEESSASFEIWFSVVVVGSGGVSTDRTENEGPPNGVLPVDGLILAPIVLLAKEITGIWELSLGRGGSAICKEDLENTFLLPMQIVGTKHVKHGSKSASERSIRLRCMANRYF